MRETETLYSALGKKGRMGAGGSEGGREGEVFGIASLPPFHSLLCLPVSLFLSTHPTLPTLPLPNLQRCTLVWNMGVRAHTHSKFARVCMCMWTCEMAERSRSVTDMHVRVPWIQHPGTPLLFFFFFFLFLKLFSFFYYCYFLILFEYFWFLVQRKNHTKRSPFFPPSCSFSVFFLILSSNLDLLSICPFHTIFLSLHHHHRACFGYERSWNSRAQI